MRTDLCYFGFVLPVPPVSMEAVAALITSAHPRDSTDWLTVSTTCHTSSICIVRAVSLCMESRQGSMDIALISSLQLQNTVRTYVPVILLSAKCNRYNICMHKNYIVLVCFMTALLK